MVASFRGPHCWLGRFVWYNLNNGVVTASWFTVACQRKEILRFRLLSVPSIFHGIPLHLVEMMEKGETVDSKKRL
jgi:hypothetical protein